LEEGAEIRATWTEGASLADSSSGEEREDVWVNRAGKRRME